jgi:hypothetical protein
VFHRYTTHDRDYRCVGLVWRGIAGTAGYQSRPRPPDRPVESPHWVAAQHGAAMNEETLPGPIAQSGPAASHPTAAVPHRLSQASCATFAPQPLVVSGIEIKNCDKTKI